MPLFNPILALRCRRRRQVIPTGPLIRRRQAPLQLPIRSKKWYTDVSKAEMPAVQTAGRPAGRIASFNRIVSSKLNAP
jgi:hypothetical protein